MDDPNNTMKEYIRLEEEKAQKRGKVFNWKLLSMERSGMMKTFTTSDLLTEPILNPQHIDEFDLIGETLVSECDEEEHNNLYFNDLFSLNVIHPNYLKLEKDNDDNKIDIIQSSEGNEISHGSIVLSETSHDKINKTFRTGSFVMNLKVKGYTEEIVHDFEQRLETIFGRKVNRVHILDFEGLTLDIRPDLAERMRMLYTRDDGHEVYISAEEMAVDGFGAYWLGSERLIPDKGDLSDDWVGISSSRDFLRDTPLYTYIRDPVQRLYHRLISYSIFRRGEAPEKVTATDLFYLRSMDQGVANVPCLLSQYLFRHAEGRKIGARLSGGHFIGRLAHHFGLVSDDGLRELSVVARELPLIDTGNLVKLNIYMDLGDDWAWVAPRLERQQVATAGASEAAEDVHVADEGGQAISAPVQAPQQPLPPPLAAAMTMP
nr:hypothetical protein [Tanacetum cinerariifolium]